MSGTIYKKRISQSLDTMNATELKQAWLILQEIHNNRDTPVIVNKKYLEAKLAKGIQQLNNGEGTDFVPFIDGLKKKYVKR